MITDSNQPPSVGPVTANKIDRLTNFDGSHLPSLCPKSETAVQRCQFPLIPGQQPDRKKKEKRNEHYTMAGEPGEAMAHSAFDTILVLDFG